MSTSSMSSGNKRSALRIHIRAQVGQPIPVTTDSGKTFETKCRLDTPVEIDYFNSGGILHYVLRKLCKA